MGIWFETMCIWFEGARRCSWHGMWPADERTLIFIFLAQMMIAELFWRHSENRLFSRHAENRIILKKFGTLSSEKCNLRNSQAEDFL